MVDFGFVTLVLMNLPSTKIVHFLLTQCVYNTCVIPIRGFLSSSKPSHLGKHKNNVRGMISPDAIEFFHSVSPEMEAGLLQTNLGRLTSC